jgi:hypothetical protein
MITITVSLGQNAQPTPDTSEAITPQPGPLTYTVQPGDTLGDIAIKFDVSEDEIVQANHLGNVEAIHIGDVLIVPIHLSVMVSPTPKQGIMLRQTSSPVPVSPSATRQLPTATDTPQATPKQACATVDASLAAVWAQVQSRIGCPQGQALSGQVVIENFERGKMMWRQPLDTGTQDMGYALVLSAGGAWKRYGHTPYRGGGGTSCAEAAGGIPTGGFGMMWCDMPEIRQSLGNATSGEQNYASGNVMLDFDHGSMIGMTNGTTYIFYDDGTWEQQ